MIKKMTFFLMLWATSLSVLAQETPVAKEFTVSGKVKNGNAGEKIYLQFSTNPPTTLDSTTMDANGNFSIKGVEKDGGNFYILNIAERQKIILLIEGGEQLTVLADGYEADSKGVAGKAEVKGSKNMEYYAQLIDMNQAMVSKVNKWNDEYAKANEKKDTKKIQEIQTNFQQAEAEHVTKIKNLIPEMGTSLVAIFAANNLLNPQRDLADMEAVAQRFAQENPSPKIVQAYIGYIKRIKGVAVGDEAPDFTLNSPEGQQVSLSSLRGKYVLLDFWASWCGPCRMENPNVVKMYAKYKDKGFAIYGVSLDKDMNAWTAAIKKDGLTWTHGSDLKYWSSAVAQLYGVNAIPATYLLDKDGKVIAKNLRGPSLENKLAELLDGEK
ncbi:TlpA disulfide reductase family protein [Arundinibacter roseus]|uniref:AhpC/TSA family protein n=1 Tax=Arundinibacter roseus TaxID=2070510 RepID=A0A4R4KL47_9BACT|nr:TlpA disulfide reductase family protein [Arundinibacter roseus]TDB69054.1 AhpC/TSA family protein [Arundinibacter roseus]